MFWTHKEISEVFRHCDKKFENPYCPLKQPTQNKRLPLCIVYCVGLGRADVHKVYKGEHFFKYYF